MLEPRRTLSEQEDEESDWITKLKAASGFSPRELEVFGLLLEGMSQQEIAERLVVAPGTVRAHVSNIYKKLDVHSRNEFDVLCWSKEFPSAAFRE